MLNRSCSVSKVIDNHQGDLGQIPDRGSGVHPVSCQCLPAGGVGGSLSGRKAAGV
jgi:hypothetical protein